VSVTEMGVRLRLTKLADNSYWENVARIQELQNPKGIKDEVSNKKRFPLL
jgi:hypothetical protein